MAITVDLLERRKTEFLVWCPSNKASAPELIIGQLQEGNPPRFTPLAGQPFPLQRVASLDGLWRIAASACGLQNGQVYHYWFRVDDSRSQTNPPARVVVTDPFAFAADWRLFPPGDSANSQPAAVIKFAAGQLVAADPGGETASFANEPKLDTLAPNNRLVIYELPTAWTLSRSLNEFSIDVGTFRDAVALVDETQSGANFAGLALFAQGQAHLVTLGVNAVELLPPADSFYKREWGYGTAHFFAPDYDLGYPEGDASPTPNSDLAQLVTACHRKGIRVLADMVMAFGHETALEQIDFDTFFIANPDADHSDPDALTSGRGGDGHQEVRNGFGSDLFRYTRATPTPTYDPVTGAPGQVVPARAFMFAQLVRWIREFHIDGVRMDSVENVANWDFIGAFTKLGRDLWHERWTGQSLAGTGDGGFIVVGEELSRPLGLLNGRLDALWNDRFRECIRAAILGQSVDGESFADTICDGIDCLRLGFTDGAQAVNYLTSHDVEGFRKERLFTMLRNDPLELREKRIKLAFACLLTAVGIPMILAGEEFADEHDFFGADGHVSQQGGKQVDPVNFGRLLDSSSPIGQMRRQLFSYVARLVKFRTQADALSVNDTEFIHFDFNEGKRVIAWKRGAANHDPVIVVANFSDFTSANALTDPNAGYQLNNWPATPAGRQWVEITQVDPAKNSRVVDPAKVSREPIFAWEAKVYTLA